MAQLLTMQQSNNEIIRIVFLGTPSYVSPILKELEQNFDTKAIRKPVELDIKALQEFKPDLLVVAAFGKILSPEILSIPKIGTINIHPSLLPKYRGPSPVQETLLNGDTETGVTLILMDEQVDHGPILWQKKVKLKGDETFESLVTQLFKLASKHIIEVINSYKQGSLKPMEQDHKEATFTKMLNRDSGFININSLETGNSKLEIARRIRAYYPWPGVWFRTNLGGTERIIKLLPNYLTPQQPNAPFLIQVEGKKEMTFKDFSNGYPGGKEILDKLNLL